MKLLQGVSPDSKLLDYWATPSSCLTDLEITEDQRDPQPLQPAYLNELTRLTWLSFSDQGQTDDDDDDAPVGNELDYAFELPVLKDLCVSLLADKVEIQCPQLKLLRMKGCSMDKLYLQASLEHLHLENSGLSNLTHEGFPITNLIGLTYLSFDDEADIDSEALPLMTRLHTLKCNIWVDSMPAKLPKSLQVLTLVFSIDEA